MEVDRLTCIRFLMNFPNNGTDLADLCSVVRCDPKARGLDDKALREHLERLFGDSELISKLWAAYRWAGRR